MLHSGCGKGLEGRIVYVAEWYGVKSLSYIAESMYPVKSNPGVHAFRRELLRSQNRFYVNQFFVEGRARLTLRVLIVARRLESTGKDCTCCLRKTVKIIVFVRVMAMCVAE